MAERKGITLPFKINDLKCLTYQFRAFDIKGLFAEVSNLAGYPLKKETAALAGPLGDGSILNQSVKLDYLIALSNAIALHVDPPFFEPQEIDQLIQNLDTVEGDPDLEDDDPAEECDLQYQLNYSDGPPLPERIPEFQDAYDELIINGRLS